MLQYANNNIIIDKECRVYPLISMFLCNFARENDMLNHGNDILKHNILKV